jgi:hypothetical protein
MININDGHIIQVNSDTGRTYDVKGKKYPSVSTLLSKFEPKDGLRNWQINLGRDCVLNNPTQNIALFSESELYELGAKAAAETRKSSSSRGTKVHTLIEEYFKHGYISDNPYFVRVRPFLQICNPLAVEARVCWELIENNLIIGGFAGTLDNISWVDGAGLLDTNNSQPFENKRLTIMDWKTWTKAKYPKGELLGGGSYYPLIRYFLQLTAYLAGFNRSGYYGEKVAQAMLVGITENCRQPFIYYIGVEELNWYFQQIKGMVKAYFLNVPFDWNTMCEIAHKKDYLGKRLYLKKA